LFATALHLLLKEDIEDIDRAIIDIEYRGKEDKIKEHLINLLRRSGKRVEAHQIQFDWITKQSPAHRTAIRTFRGQRKPDHVVSLDEWLREF
jgi:D-ribose pyranose/furanose isomerase RbsD